MTGVEKPCRHLRARVAQGFCQALGTLARNNPVFIPAGDPDPHSAQVWQFLGPNGIIPGAKSPSEALPDAEAERWCNVAPLE